MESKQKQQTLEITPNNGNEAAIEPVKLEPRSADMMGLLHLALNNNAAIDVIERIVALRREELARIAETEFNEALNQAQAEMVRIAPDLKNNQTNSRYASYAALDKMVRPVYTKHGFSLSFDEEDSPKPDHVRIVAFLSRSGHTRKYRKDICADGKGAKGGDVMTRTHAEAAADSYGMRYLTKKIFNLAIGEEDNDGNISMGEAADFLAVIAESKTIEELKKHYQEAVADGLKKQSSKAVDLYMKARQKREAELRGAA